jgi:hypothetical protein
MSTSLQTVRKHLLKNHGEEYKRNIAEHKWDVNLAILGDSSQNYVRAVRDDTAIPPFSGTTFLEHLMDFIVLNDQVIHNNLTILYFSLTHPLQSIRVVECPEFRKLCLLLRDNLVDRDIPSRDKMREFIMDIWKKKFEELLVELQVRLCFTLSAPLLQ